ncbi:hypothetical protein [Rhodoferax ferrireducens]|uniref:hypothetical protein n=1 Tax=Rhodoferax ferrireducens TaxID=192843 RepID=UPI003BB77106
MLTHYTRNATAVGSILTHGFAWLPNRRKLAHVLIPGHDFSRREPQQFGMISFTEIEPPHAEVHCDTFGHYGIVVSEAWAAPKKAQRVIYVEETGPVTETLKLLFAIGYADVTSKIEYPDDGGWQMAYENKAAASAIAGSTMWAHLLQLWEYLEPAASAAQREWRIVNTEPFYSLSENKAEAIAQVSPPQNWAKFTNVVPIPRSEVIALVCRSRDKQSLRANIPPAYQDVTIIETGG